MRPLVQTLPSVATASNERWAMDLRRVWASREDWLVLDLVIDRHPPANDLAGIYHTPAKPRRRKPPWSKAPCPVWHAGPRVCAVLASRRQRACFHQPQLHGAGTPLSLRQEFIAPHGPEQNGMVERVIRTLKGQRVHCHRFKTLEHPSDHRRMDLARRQSGPHPALGHLLRNFILVA